MYVEQEVLSYPLFVWYHEKKGLQLRRTLPYIALVFSTRTYTSHTVHQETDQKRPHHDHHTMTVGSVYVPGTQVAQENHAVEEEAVPGFREIFPSPFREDVDRVRSGDGAGAVPVAPAGAAAAAMPSNLF